MRWLWIIGLVVLVSSHLRAQEPPTPTRMVTLREAVRLAIERNLELASVRYEPLVGEAEIQVEKGAFDPVLFAQAGRSVFSIPSVFPGEFGDQRDTDASIGLSHRMGNGATYSVEHFYLGQTFLFGPTGESFARRGDTVLTLEYPLLQGGGGDVNRAPVDIAIQQQRRDVLTLKEQALDTAQEVEQAYWFLVQALMLYDTQRQSVERAAEFLDLLNTGIQEGALAPYEAYEAAQNLDRFKADLAASERDIYLAERSLLRLLRMDLEGDGLRPAEIPKFTPPEKLPVDALVKDALENRPELERARLAVEVLRTQGRVEENGLLPVLDLVGEYRLSQVRSDLYRWRVGVELEIPLGNREARGRYTRNRLLTEQAVLVLEDQQQAITLEVTQAIRAVEENARRAGFAREARIEAEKRLTAEMERFRAGLGTAHLVNFAEQQLIGAQQLEVDALVDYQLAEVSLHRALGTTLARYDVTVDEAAR
ncbi:MAG: TolC family protein [Armatimonadetes bacterium]|nr:TolC family protein [Armatimonadota bacterium]